MRRSAPLLCALLLAVPGALSTARAEVTRIIRAELPAADLSRFVIENLAGTMKVSIGPGPGVVAIATIHAEDDGLAAAMRFERVEGGPPAEENGAPTLRVRYPLDRHSTLRYPRKDGECWLMSKIIDVGRTRMKYDGHQVSISNHSGVLLYADVEVQVPNREIGATFRNRVGRLDGRGMQGEIRFDTDSGDIAIASARGHIVADTGSGDVKVAGLRGTLRCDTGSGDCDLGEVEGDEITADTGSGDIVVRGGKVGRLVGDTGSGDIRALDVDLEEFKADTGSGNVTLQARSVARLIKVKADTGSGDVILRLGPDASFEAIADQGSGDILNRYSDAQPILKKKELIGYRRGSGTIRILVDTGSGDLTLDPGGARSELTLDPGGVSGARDRTAAPGNSRSR